MLRTISTSEKPVNFYQPTQRCVPDDSHIIFVAVRTSKATGIFSVSVVHFGDKCKEVRRVFDFWLVLQVSNHQFRSTNAVCCMA
jgi:hypothetical protein